ncbi:MAG: type II toxin-antitoxin system RelB/DinJ family antitoxin [Steroidobacteraceae bacterium]
MISRRHQFCRPNMTRSGGRRRHGDRGIGHFRQHERAGAARDGARIDSELKANARRVLAACGLEQSDAIRLFLQQVVAHQGIWLAM